MKIDMHIILCMHTVCLQTHPCLKNTPCLHMQISTTPLLGYVHIFQQYLQHTYVSIHVQRYVREALIIVFRFLL